MSCNFTAITYTECTTVTYCTLHTRALHQIKPFWIHGEVQKDTEEADSLLPHSTLPGRIGTGILDVSVKIPNLSSVTGVLSGAYKKYNRRSRELCFLSQSNRNNKNQTIKLTVKYRFSTALLQEGVTRQKIKYFMRQSSGKNQHNY